MARSEFREALDALRESVLEMGELVLDRFEQAIEALDEGEERLAREVIDGDAEVNDRYLAIEQDCIDLLALQQPVASDLRFVAASFKIITDLERIGDLATNLAGHALTKERDFLPEVNVRDVAEIAVEMVEAALAAYADDDPELCHRVADQDDELDGLCERVAELVIYDLVDRDATDAVDDDLLPAVDRLLLTIRDVERVGDHAVNIAARTLYMVESSDVLLY